MLFYYCIIYYSTRIQHRIGYTFLRIIRLHYCLKSSYTHWYKWISQNAYLTLWNDHMRKYRRMKRNFNFNILITLHTVFCLYLFYLVHNILFIQYRTLWVSIDNCTVYAVAHSACCLLSFASVSCIFIVYFI